MIEATTLDLVTRYVANSFWRGEAWPLAPAVIEGVRVFAGQARSVRACLG